MAYRQIWLAQVLRDAGLNVVEVPGWQTRGHGEMGNLLGVMCHHTAGSRNGDAPSLNVVRDGRPDVSGPLAQLVLARSGTYHVVAAGKCWHAGKGAWRVHGGGFAGTILALVPLELLEPYQEQMERVFGQGCCYRFAVRPVGGIKLG